MKNYEYSVELRNKYNYENEWCIENSFDLALKNKNIKINKIERILGFLICKEENIAILHSWNAVNDDFIDVTTPEILKSNGIEYYQIDRIDTNVMIDKDLKHMSNILSFYEYEINKFVKNNSDMEIISHRDTLTGEIIYFNKPDKNKIKIKRRIKK